MSTNPLLANLKLPGRIFQLPSKGLFYKNGELSEPEKNGEVHVQPMSALDEITIKNPDQLFSGDGISTIVRRCITGIEKPEELLTKDVDAIMVFLRVVTYGPEYEYTVKHNCKDSKEHTYNIDLESFITNTVMLDDVKMEANYSVQLKNGQTVKLRPNTYQDVIDMIKDSNGKSSMTSVEQQKSMLKVLLSIIESVDGISDQAMIEEWITKVPSPLISTIAKKMESLNDWGPSLTTTVQCKDCGEDIKVDIPINPVTFFTE